MNVSSCELYIHVHMCTSIAAHLVALSFVLPSTVHPSTCSLVVSDSELGQPGKCTGMSSSRMKWIPVGSTPFLSV